MTYNIDMKIQSYKKIVKFFVFACFFNFIFLSIYENFLILDFVLIKIF